LYATTEDPAWSDRGPVDRRDSQYDHAV